VAGGEQPGGQAGLPAAGWSSEHGRAARRSQARIGTGARGRSFSRFSGSSMRWLSHRRRRPRGRPIEEVGWTSAGVRAPASGRPGRLREISVRYRPCGSWRPSGWVRCRRGREAEVGADERGSGAVTVSVSSPPVVVHLHGTAPDPFVAPYFSFLLRPDAEAPARRAAQLPQGRVPDCEISRSRPRPGKLEPTRQPDVIPISSVGLTPARRRRRCDTTASSCPKSADEAPPRARCRSSPAKRPRLDHAHWTTGSRASPPAARLLAAATPDLRDHCRCQERVICTRRSLVAAQSGGLRYRCRAWWPLAAMRTVPYRAHRQPLPEGRTRAGGRRVRLGKHWYVARVSDVDLDVVIDDDVVMEPAEKSLRSLGLEP